MAYSVGRLWSGADQADVVLLAKVPRDHAAEHLPIRERECPDRFPHPDPEVEDAFLEFAHLPEQRAAMLLHLIDQEGEHGERREDVRQMVFPFQLCRYRHSRHATFRTMPRFASGALAAGAFPYALRDSQIVARKAIGGSDG